MGQRLNRRQRKKHRKGECREFGFIVKAALREAHRALVREWLEAQPALTDVHVTPLFDAWHDWPGDDTESAPA